jgi:hypothetical protein
MLILKPIHKHNTCCLLLALTHGQGLQKYFKLFIWKFAE